MSQRSNALATRLEEGAAALEKFARDLTDEQWQARLPKRWATAISACSA